MTDEYLIERITKLEEDLKERKRWRPFKKVSEFFRGVGGFFKTLYDSKHFAPVLILIGVIGVPSLIISWLVGGWITGNYYVAYNSGGSKICIYQEHNWGLDKDVACEYTDDDTPAYQVRQFKARSAELAKAWEEINEN